MSAAPVHRTATASTPVSARRTYARLGVPTFGLALSATAIGTYLPLIAHRLGMPAPMIGVLLAAPGVALAGLSVLVGRASDRTGGRRDYLAAGSACGAAALTVAAIAHAQWLLAAAAALFAVSYVVAYEPYRAAILDAVPAGRIASAQGAQAVWRALGTAAALICGGVLAGRSLHAPLLCAAAALLASGLAGRWLLPRRGPIPRAAGATVWRTLTASRPLRRSLLVSGLAELAQGVVRAFGLLYATQRLHLSTGAASFVFALFLALGIFAAVASGAAAERIGTRRTVLGGAVLYGAGIALVASGTGSTALLVAALIAAATGGGITGSLSYALGAREIPASLRGALTGATSAARGVGMAIGPPLGGILVVAAGYAAAFWVACGAAMLTALVLLRD